METILTLDSIEDFLSGMYADGKTENTVRAYKSDLMGFLKWTQEMKLLAPTSTTTVEILAARYLTTNRATWAPRTTQRKAAALRELGRHLGKPDFLINYRCPRPGKATPHPIPELMGGVEAMLAAAGTNRDAKALVALCGLCGLRVSEALAVRPADIDLGERMLKIRGKGDSTRTVPISARAMAQIAPAIESSVKHYDGAPLVAWKDRYARYKLTRLASQAGLSRHVSSHDLRATFATCVYDSNHDIRVVQELLGHSSVETTQVYTGVSVANMRRAVDL